MKIVKFGRLKEQKYAMKESLRALKTNIQFCGDDIQHNRCDFCFAK